MSKNKINIYKSGTAEYYRDQLNNISAVALHYDGFNINSAKQMKELIDDLKTMGDDVLNHKKLYLGIKGNKNEK